MLTSTESFLIEGLVANGQIEMYVGLDPIGILNSDPTYIWSAKSDGRPAQIEVKTSDEALHLAAWYYIYTKAISSVDAILSIKVTQVRKVNYISNNRDQLFTI